DRHHAAPSRELYVAQHRPKQSELGGAIDEGRLGSFESLIAAGDGHEIEGPNVVVEPLELQRLPRVRPYREAHETERLPVDQDPPGFRRLLESRGEVHDRPDHG